MKGLLVGFNASPLGQEFGAIDPDLKCVGAPPDARLLSEVLEMIRPAANVVWKEGCPENNDPGAVDRHIG